MYNKAALLKLASDVLKMESVVEKTAKMQKDMDESKPIIMHGLKGMKSTRATKKFKNMAAYDKWADSEDAGNWTVQSIENE